MLEYVCGFLLGNKIYLEIRQPQNKRNFKLTGVKGENKKAKVRKLT